MFVKKYWKFKVKKAIAIIPARGGSKRIPRKNIKDFFWKTFDSLQHRSCFKI
jgi:hypothetical protein